MVAPDPHGCPSWCALNAMTARGVSKVQGHVAPPHVRAHGHTGEKNALSRHVALQTSIAYIHFGECQSVRGSRSLSAGAKLQCDISYNKQKNCYFVCRFNSLFLTDCNGKLSKQPPHPKRAQKTRGNAIKSQNYCQGNGVSCTFQIIAKLSRIFYCVRASG